MVQLVSASYLMMIPACRDNHEVGYGDIMGTSWGQAGILGTSSKATSRCSRLFER